MMTRDIPNASQGPEVGREFGTPVSDHYVVTDEDADAVWFLGTLATIKAGGARTGGALAVVEFTHPAGFATPAHIHHTADEAFYVLEGRIEGFCGDRRWQAGPGALVWLPRDVPHGYGVAGDEPARTLAITIPASLERLVLEAGEPAPERSLPPPKELDTARLDAVAAAVGITHLGPPGQWPDGS